MSRLVVRPQAKNDIREAAIHYERERPGLGDTFLDEVTQVFTRIRTLPKQFPNIGKDVRRALLRRFPYAVYFLMSEQVASAAVVILAVLHQHRAPATWKRRLQADKKSG